MKVNVTFLTMLIRGVADLQLQIPNENFNNAIAGESKLTNKHKTLFEELQTDYGINNVKAWFQDHVHRQNGLSENQFLSFFHKLTDLSDYEILEIFDIFGASYFNSLVFRNLRLYRSFSPSFVDEIPS
jgi:arabinogalactan endo-1,4-beta-galactosidase